MLNFNPMLRVFALCSMLSAGVTELHAQSFPLDSVQRYGARNKRINLVFVSDGYQSSEMNTFVTNVTSINNGLMLTVPFSEYKTFFNTYLVKVPSTNSGAKHPANAADESSSGNQPVANPSTYFGSTFDYGSIHRLVVPTSNSAVYNVLSANLPQYNQGFILVNSPYYGGSGGTFATSTTHSSAAEIAIHEIGHSFASLADEYWAGDGYASEKANMTKTSDPATVKWRNWIGVSNVGVYPYGSSGNPANWYRPHQQCKMQYLNYPFCPVCVATFVDKIHALVNMVDSYTPTTTSFTLTDTSARTFTVNHLQTTRNTISIKWYLNGSSTPFATGASVTVPYSRFATGSNTLRATAFDSTSFSKSYLPAIGYSNSVTWTVSKPSAFARLTNLTGELVHNTRILNWQPEEGVQAESYAILRSTDGVHYKTIAQVKGDSEQYMDNNAISGPAYYKVAVKSSGGNFTSGSVLIKDPLSSNNFKVFQDASARKYHFNYGSNNGANVAITVTNANGTKVLQKGLGKSGSSQRYEFDLSGQPAGIYFFTIMIGDEVYTAKLLAL